MSIAEMMELAGAGRAPASEEEENKLGIEVMRICHGQHMAERKEGKGRLEQMTL